MTFQPLSLTSPLDALSKLSSSLPASTLKPQGNDFIFLSLVSLICKLRLMVPTLVASQGGTKRSHEIKDNRVLSKLQIVLQTNRCCCCVLSPGTQESIHPHLDLIWVGKGRILRFYGGGASFSEAQFHLGMPEGHQQVPGLLGSGHLAASSEVRRESLAKVGEGRRQGGNGCLRGIDQRSVIYPRACCFKFNTLLSFSGIQTSTTDRSLDSSEGSRIVYVYMCTEVPLV